MDKTFLVEQLGAKLRALLQNVHRASSAAQADSRSGAQRAVNLARGQERREVEVRAALEALDAFRPKPLGKSQPIGLGAVVELEDEDAQGGRTLFLAPVGAG